MNYFRDQKKKVFEYIQNQIDEHDGIEKEKLISRIEIEVGASKEKANEYLTTMQVAGKIKFENNKVWRA